MAAGHCLNQRDDYDNDNGADGDLLSNPPRGEAGHVPMQRGFISIKF